MSIYKDEYMIGQSTIKSISGVAEAIRLDLSLNPNPHLNAATVTGRVQDTTGRPVADAVVIILDENYEIKSNTTTGTDGLYTFTSIDPGQNYHAYSQAPGYKMADSGSFTLSTNQVAEINFTLSPDTDEIWSVITGNVLNDRGFPIGSASIELFKVDESDTKPVAITFTNEVGQYILRDLVPGSYLMKVTATGYFSDFFPIEINKNRSIFHTQAVLKEDLKASKGIIVGVITDNEDQPLANADVILYRMGIDQSMTPVAYTRTNHEGVYLFLNVPHGEYRVNSNRSVIID